jgi:hypothetical protein
VPVPPEHYANCQRRESWRHFAKQLLPAFVLIVSLAFVCVFATAALAEGVLNIDKEFGQVSGWKIGFSEDRGGCVAAAKYDDQTKEPVPEICTG